MKILYGVVGEGMGHAIRSRVILEHLEARGHHVKVVVSGRAYGFLAKHFSDVVEISGLPMLYANNAVDVSATTIKILTSSPAWALDNIEAYVRDVRKFDANVVITDFDSFAHFYAKQHRKPILSIDNQHSITRLEHDEDVFIERDEQGNILHDYRPDYELARNVVKAKISGCDHYLITTFFFPPIKRKHQATTSLFPPILRNEILEAKKHATQGAHVLVYQTSASYTGLLDHLAKMPGEFRVYGFLRPDAPKPKGTAEGSDIRYAPNVLLRAFSEAQFIDDMASSRAVVTGGGFTVIGEAVYLGKPIYSVPVQNHFEQTISARYLEKLRYGEHHEALEPATLEKFLTRVPEYTEALRDHHQDGNRALFAKLDDLLASLGTR